MITRPRPPGPEGHGAESTITAAVPGRDQSAPAPAPSSTPAPSSVSIEPAQLRPVLEAIGTAVAQTTLFGALLYYFGAQFLEGKAGEFGVDANLFGYSTHDYILRSIVPVAPAFGGLLLIGLIFMRVHGRLREWVDSGRHLLALEWLARAMIVVGMTLLAAGVTIILGVLDPYLDWPGHLADTQPMLPPLSVLVGIVGVAYGTQILRAWLPSGASGSVLQREPRWLRSVKLALVFVLVGVNVFWAAGEWAWERGVESADGLIGHLRKDPQLIVYSKEPLGIEPDPAQGITVGRVEGAEDGYRFRYGGLRYLTQSAGKYFLLSPCWESSPGRTFVLTDDDNVRVEITQTWEPPGCK